MASTNTLTALIPKLLAQGLLALRGATIMPRLVNADYSTLAAQKGATIDVPIPSAIAAQPVTPDVYAPDPTGITPTTVPINLDQWYEAPFFLTDNDFLKVMQGVIPMQASEAIKSLAQNVNAFILALGRKFYGFTGTPGTTPFASTPADATNARKILNRQLAPTTDRRIVLDPDAEGNALNLQAFQYAAYAGSTGVIIDGTIGRKLGFDWAMDQQVPSQATTTLTAGAATVNGAHAAGVKTVSIAKATNASPLIEGDIITFAGDSQTYVVTAPVTLIVGNTNVTLEPALQAAKSGGEAMALAGAHVLNLAFHRDAIAFANRPLMDSAQGLGNLIQAAVDPVSGLALRLEVSREHKRTRFSYDILYGAAVVRRELGCRIAG